jgi:hypothetical protein
MEAIGRRFGRIVTPRKRGPKGDGKQRGKKIKTGLSP